MSGFAIEQGACGSGPARYEEGLFTLPDAGTRGIETVTDISVKDTEDGPSLQRSTGTLAASLRETLDYRGGAAPLPLPWRVALLTMRAGLGVVEEGLRTSVGVPVVITFVDGLTLTASMARELADLIRRDAGIIHAAMERAMETRVTNAVEAPDVEPELPSDPSTDAALTSIFRYEKRNGRLRRIPITDPEA